MLLLLLPRCCPCHFPLAHAAALLPPPLRFPGYYDTEEDAADAWDMAALRHFGPSATAKLNFSSSVEKFNQMTAGGSGGAAATGVAVAAAAPAAAAVPLAVPPPGAPVGLPAQLSYRGVAALDGRWKATVQHRRSQVFVGVFETAEEAARAYDRENLKLNGRGAITNFPLTGGPCSRWATTAGSGLAGAAAVVRLLRRRRRKARRGQAVMGGLVSRLPLSAVHEQFACSLAHGLASLLFCGRACHWD